MNVFLTHCSRTLKKKKVAFSQFPRGVFSQIDHVHIRVRGKRVFHNVHARPQQAPGRASCTFGIYVCMGADRFARRSRALTARSAKVHSRDFHFLHIEFLCKMKPRGCIFSTNESFKSNQRAVELRNFLLFLFLLFAFLILLEPCLQHSRL